MNKIIKKIIAREGLIIITAIGLYFFIGKLLPYVIMKLSIFGYGKGRLFDDLPYIYLSQIVLFIVYPIYVLIRFILWAVRIVRNNMDDFKKLLFLILFVTIPTSIFFLIVFYFAINFSEIYIQVITATVLFATLLAIILYTWKTGQLKDLTAKQISFNIRPIVILETNPWYRTKNIGRGVAKDITIDKIPVRKKLDLRIADNATNIYITCHSCLEPNSSMPVVNFFVIDNNGKSITLTDTLLNVYKNTIKDMSIHYKDIEGTKYTTHMKKEEGIFKLVDIK
jgi:hypothetical protein